MLLYVTSHQSSLSTQLYIFFALLSAPTSAVGANALQTTTVTAHMPATVVVIAFSDNQRQPHWLFHNKYRVTCSIINCILTYIVQYTCHNFHLLEAQINLHIHTV